MFAYSKLVRANQGTFTPGTAVTTYRQFNNPDLQPLGGAGTAAPSTILIDKENKDQFYLNKPFSAVHAAITAVTSASDKINII
jgi:hypothetical protein